jgi:nucleoside 2-deoxyribosyltransferase
MKDELASPRIYFAGSIRGGRTDAELYLQIIQYLQTKGNVLTEHIGESGLSPSGESNMTDAEIYERDLQWLTTSDFIVAEVTTPSLGVGFEIAKAADLHKKVLCIFRVGSERRLSAMISGCPDVQVIHYQSFEELKLIIDAFFAE